MSKVRADEALELAQAYLDDEDGRTHTMARICEWVVSVLGAEPMNWFRPSIVDIDPPSIRMSDDLGRAVREIGVDEVRAYCAALLRAADAAEDRSDG